MGGQIAHGLGLGQFDLVGVLDRLHGGELVLQIVHLKIPRHVQVNLDQIPNAQERGNSNERGVPNNGRQANGNGRALGHFERLGAG